MDHLTPELMLTVIAIILIWWRTSRMQAEIDFLRERVDRLNEENKTRAKYQKVRDMIDHAPDDVIDRVSNKFID